MISKKFLLEMLILPGHTNEVDYRQNLYKGTNNGS